MRSCVRGWFKRSQDDRFRSERMLTVQTPKGFLRLFAGVQVSALGERLGRRM